MNHVRIIYAFGWSIVAFIATPIVIIVLDVLSRPKNMSFEPTDFDMRKVLFLSFLVAVATFCFKYVDFYDKD